MIKGLKIPSFAKDFAIYGISSSIARFFGLFMVPIFTRVFDKTKFGNIDIISVLISMSAILIAIQLESAVARYYYSVKEKHRILYISNALIIVVFLGIVFSIGFIGFASEISELLFSTKSWHLQITLAGLIAPILAINGVLLVVLRFKGVPLFYLKVQCFQVTMNIGGVLFFLFIYPIDSSAVFAGQLLAALVTFFLMFFELRKEINFSINSKRVSEMLRYSLPLVPSVFGSWTNSYGSRFVMLAYLTAGDIGIYAVSVKVASIFQLIGSAFRMTWPQYFWKTYEKVPNYKILFVQIHKSVHILVLLLVILFIVFSRHVTLILADDSYIDANKYVGFIALSLVIQSILMTVTSMGPAITKKTKFLSFISVTGLLVNFGILFSSIELFGIVSVPISLFIGTFSSYILGWIISERLHPIGFKVEWVSVAFLFSIVFAIINLNHTWNLIEQLVVLTIVLCCSLFVFKEIRRNPNFNFGV